MSIAILPARLANQIAAGEVVERPASVIKELVENSLDAGATVIQIDVAKGGIKKIKISDNGHGIPKDELTLALSRHATSKIADLNDLEAINSLGFRGEALASISSVSRLTLTSKPKSQPTAWQAVAEGRDMSVNIKPAAHPDGTSIEVLDLFFNTPARRKFLRTEKTEFNHIDEVIRRIALANFEVSFTLTHNDTIVRQYRAANTHAQCTKRVASVCGAKFIEHAIEIDCPHGDITLNGWLAKPSFLRNQNDLCYSYVNGRMMRDKLINHAIRQAYADLLPPDTYPAFVLFLQLDHKEVDVNVHPAKHEVRFHQSRYVHDFIYSACHKALTSALVGEELLFTSASEQPEKVYTTAGLSNGSLSIPSASPLSTSESDNPSAVNYPRAEYIKPLQPAETNKNASTTSYYQGGASFGSANHVSPVAASNYQTLMTPAQTSSNDCAISNTSNVSKSETSEIKLLTVESPGYALYMAKGGLRLLSLFNLAKNTYPKAVAQSLQSNDESSINDAPELISQPLLLPVIVSLSDEQFAVAMSQQVMFSRAGIVFVDKTANKIQIRQFPALLRECDVTNAIITVIDELLRILADDSTKQASKSDLCQCVGLAMVFSEYDENQAHLLLKQAKNVFEGQLTQQLLLNSVPLDLTSTIEKLN